MITELIDLIKMQNEDLSQLLVLLETQYTMIVKHDAFGLEALVDKLGQCSKRIAQEEVERRKLLGNQSIKKFVQQIANAELTEAYENIQKTLKKVTDQKETNDMLLKQQLLINNKMLCILNPDRQIKTYNAYGNLSR